MPDEQQQVDPELIKQLSAMSPDQLKTYETERKKDPNLTPQAFKVDFLSRPNVGQGSVNPLGNEVSNRLAMGGAMAIPGALTGGPLGALAGFGAGAIFPPQTAGEAAVAGLGFPEAGAMGALERTALKHAPAWLKAITRGGAGAAQHQLNTGVMNAMGDPAPSGLQNGLGAGISAALPMLGGAVGDRVKKSINLTDTIRDTMGQPSMMPREAPTTVPTSQAGAQATYADMMAQQQAQQKMQGAAQEAAKAQLAKMAQQKAQLLEQKAHLDLGLVTARASDQAENAFQRQRVAKQLTEIDKKQNDIQLKFGISKQADAQAGQQNDLTMQALDSANTKTQQSIIDLQTQKKAIARGIDPQSGQSVNLPKQQRAMLLQGLDEQIAGHQQDILQRKLSTYAKLDEDAANPQLAATADVQTNVQNRQLELWQEKTALQGDKAGIQVPPPTNGAANTAKVAIAENKIEQVRWKNNFDELKASVSGKSGIVSDPLLNELVSGGSATPTFDTFKSNLLKATPTHIDALYEHLNSQAGGKEKMNDIRDMMMSEMFKRAYDPQSKGFTNFDKLMSPDGPFSYDKIRSMYGGGTEGRQAVDKFSALAADIRDISKPATTNWQSRAAVGAAIATPLSLMFHVPFYHGLLAGEGAVVAAVGLPKLVDNMMTNPTLYKAFHTWAQAGGSAQAMQAQPELFNWVKHQNIIH